jgi:hypothetical protein
MSTPENVANNPGGKLPGEGEGEGAESSAIQPPLPALSPKTIATGLFPMKERARRLFGGRGDTRKVALSNKCTVFPSC